MAKNDLTYINVQIKRPKGDFPGRIAEGQFVVEGNHVLLYDMEGQFIDREPIPDGCALSPREIASRALKRHEGSRVSDFNRRIYYGKNYY